MRLLMVGKWSFEKTSHAEKFRPTRIGEPLLDSRKGMIECFHISPSFAATIFGRVSR
jgi:hypothetical protein